MSGGWSGRKLALVVVDSLRTDILRQCAADGLAPNLAALLERGDLVPDCVSSFPSVTPVATADMTTGARPDLHAISGVNWYHRVERRYVEYGSSFEATRALGLIRTLYDIVYDMNLSHLSPEVTTVFERLGDRAIRTACTPFLIYRGRHRHELGLEGVLRRVAVAASFRHAVWGPDELFYGELYASRKVDCPPTLARPGTRDPYSACVGRELASERLYDFLLFSLPDNDHHSHRYGPAATVDSVARADGCLGELISAWGGLDAFCDEHAVIVCADHAQTEVSEPLPLIDAVGERWRVLRPSSERPEEAEVAVSPCARAGAVYVLVGDARGRAVHSAARDFLSGLDGVDLVAWLVDADGEPLLRSEPRPATDAAEAVVAGGGRQLRFRPGTTSRDPRGAGWDLDGDARVLDGHAAGGGFASETYPDALARLWAALTAPNAGDIQISLGPGYECVDWGAASHVGGGSHGSLAAGDSLGPLLACGLEGFDPDCREQWTVADIAGLIDDHFAIRGSTGAEDVHALESAH